MIILYDYKAIHALSVSIHRQSIAAFDELSEQMIMLLLRERHLQFVDLHSSARIDRDELIRVLDAGADRLSACSLALDDVSWIHVVLTYRGESMVAVLGSLTAQEALKKRRELAAHVYAFGDRALGRVLGHSRLIVSERAQQGPSIWSLLTSIIGPAKHIMIIDRYQSVFCKSFKSNLGACLRRLIVDMKSEVEMEVVIVTAAPPREADRSTILTLEYLQQSLADVLRSHTNVRIALRQIELSQSRTLRRKMHDRRIITDQFLIKSGNSFNYYSDNDPARVVVETELDFYPLTHEEDYNDARSIRDYWTSMSTRSV